MNQYIYYRYKDEPKIQRLDLDGINKISIERYVDNGFYQVVLRREGYDTKRLWLFDQGWYAQQENGEALLDEMMSVAMDTFIYSLGLDVVFNINPDYWEEEAKKALERRARSKKLMEWTDGWTNTSEDKTL